MDLAKKEQNIFQGKCVNKCNLCEKSYLTVVLSTTNKCTECQLDRKKSKGVPIELLKESYVKNALNLTKTSKELSISDNAIKKRLIKYYPSEWISWQKAKKICTYCNHCGKEKSSPSKKYCSDECFNQKVKRYQYNPEQILKTLANHSGNISKTAKELGLSRKPLKQWLLSNNLIQS